MSVRQERVQAQLLTEISDLIRKELRDPRIGFVTLTGAEVTRDLRHAKIFISQFGDEEDRKACLKALNGAAGMMRGEFARRVHLRVAPEIIFLYDIGLERGQRIFDVLNTLDIKEAPAEEKTETA